MLALLRRLARPLLVVAVATVAGAVWLSPAPAQAPESPPPNLTRLIADAQLIVVGRVMRVSDGVTPQGQPYTEVTLAVSDCPKGGLREGARHTFRQFGLVAPRRMPDGSMLLALSPAGYPRWQEGERVVAFLAPPARRTGLQTTVGLAQGKLTLVDGRIVSDLGNRGLFDGVRIRAELLSDPERSMLAASGPVDATTFLGLVGRSVTGRWIESGSMR